MSPRYGVAWPDGGITGDITDDITDSQRLAAAYAKNHNGSVYEADANGDPITAPKTPASASTEEAVE